MFSIVFSVFLKHTRRGFRGICVFCEKFEQIVLKKFGDDELLSYFCGEKSGKTPMSNKALRKKIADYFKTKPVLKAWLFGSFARGEETPHSDVDILVAYDNDAHVSLLTIGGIYMDLKELLQREVDLVEEGTLLPFAEESANKDKVLIYERR